MIMLISQSASTMPCRKTLFSLIGYNIIKEQFSTTVGHSVAHQPMDAVYHAQTPQHYLELSWLLTDQHLTPTELQVAKVLTSS